MAGNGITKEPKPVNLERRKNMEWWEDENWWKEKHPAHEVLIARLWQKVSEYQRVTYSGGVERIVIDELCSVLRFAIIPQDKLGWVVNEIEKISFLAEKGRNIITVLLNDLRGRLVPQKTSKVGTSSRSPEPDLC